MDTAKTIIALPAPRSHGSMSLETALAQRRTIRDLQPGALTDAEMGQLLWAAQGITHDGSRRTAPSASGLLALETYVANGDGLFRYIASGHSLQQLGAADIRGRLQEATGGQPFVATAPAVVAFSTTPGRLSGRHGEDRAVRYADFEAGHAGQNLLLQATALGLGAVPVGSFDDNAVCRLLDLPDGESPRYLFAVGRPA